jgi:hypothetical protein
MKTYMFIVRYSMKFLKGGLELTGDHLFADSYLVKLIKGLDNVVHIGVETAIGEEDVPREHFFKAEGLDATFKAMAIFSEQDKDFAKSFMNLDELGDDGALTMEYKEVSYEPITEEEREYSKESIDHDPRDTFEMLEGDDEPLVLEGIVVEDDDDYWGDDDDEDEPN